MSSRPVTDRVKESLFSVLWKYHLPAGSDVADLFCGAGSMGLEALSRGAGSSLFVENDRKMIAVLKKNLAKAGFSDRSTVLCADAFAWRPDRPFGLVFVDPPYAATADVSAGSPVGALLSRLAESAAGGTTVVLRTRSTTEILDSYGGLIKIERRKWGTMAVGILQVK
jgi:16S rRNA (guanine966-N2)-methyltransferase